MTMTLAKTDTANLAVVLESLSAEMSIAAVSCGHLDSALGQILEEVPVEARMKVMQELHMVDLLAQHITAITDFTAGLAQSMAATGAPDVAGSLSRITLGDVANRLRENLAKVAT
jgi:hydrogenase maturation factor HypE